MLNFENIILELRQRISHIKCVHQIISLTAHSFQHNDVITNLFFISLTSNVQELGLCYLPSCLILANQAKKERNHIQVFLFPLGGLTSRNNGLVPLHHHVFFLHLV
ncbi:hypothetical protein Dimus_010871 [Dionaea muscipula]